jgi:hypothetical protein
MFSMLDILLNMVSYRAHDALYVRLTAYLGIDLTLTLTVRIGAAVEIGCSLCDVFVAEDADRSGTGFNARSNETLYCVRLRISSNSKRANCIPRKLACQFPYYISTY